MSASRQYLIKKDLIFRYDNGFASKNIIKRILNAISSLLTKNFMNFVYAVWRNISLFPCRTEANKFKYIKLTKMNQLLDE